MSELMNLGRIGHYSYEKVCQTAIVVDVQIETVAVAGWTKSGDSFRREGVVVGPNEEPEGEFHLNRDCPWSR